MQVLAKTRKTPPSLLLERSCLLKYDGDHIVSNSTVPSTQQAHCAETKEDCQGQGLTVSRLVGSALSHSL
ncbi:hypothetical protein EON65_53655 [archaeon]|nr:MAG: hypothetical protein EON65_53655 [archaeon]